LANEVSICTYSPHKFPYLDGRTRGVDGDFCVTPYVLSLLGFFRGFFGGGISLAVVAESVMAEVAESLKQATYLGIIRW